MGRPARPVLLFIFANPRRDLALNRETSGIRAALRSRPELELIILDHPALVEVEDLFQQRRNQIVLFHYSGHANGYQQMLESESGAEQRIDTRGFAQFLASQQGLQFAFLNGCSTIGQLDELFEAGIPSVLATNIDVDDELATQFSLRFYTGLASGADLRTAYDESVGSIRAQSPTLFSLSESNSRGIRVGKLKQASEEQFPWQIHAQNKKALEWSVETELAARRTARGGTTTVAQVQLQQLLQLVKQQWIEGILAQSKNNGLLHLSLKSMPELVSEPFDSITEGSPRSPQTIDIVNQPLINIYSQSRQKLLLLGQPGSGKTTALLQLCDELIQEARCDPALPVPVVFSLSRWHDNAQTFYNWLQQQLVELYSAPRKITGQWLDGHELILLLDGFDEVATELRPGCAIAINEYLGETGAAGIVVSSRVDEYSELPEKLNVVTAVLLQPLTDDQVHEFVEASGRELTTLGDLLRRNETLRNLAQSPLLLNIMSQAFDENSTDTAPDNASQLQHTNNLFDRFIDRMFRRRGSAKEEYTRAETENRLSWLANRMRQEGSSVFLIELMQPSWLATRAQRACYAIIISLILALVMGLSAGVYWWGTAKISADTTKSLDSGLFWWLIPLVFLWLIAVTALDKYLPNFAARGNLTRWKKTLQGLSKGLIYFTAWFLLLSLPSLLSHSQWETIWVELVLTGSLGSILLAVAGWSHRTMMDIQPVESVKFSWRSAIKTAPIGLVVGVIVWLVYRFVWTEEPNIRLVLAPEWKAGQGFGFMLFAMSTVGIVGGGLLGSFERSSMKLRTRPNQGMINSRRNAIYVGAVTATVLTIAIVLISLMQDLEGMNRTMMKLIQFSFSAGWLVFVCVAMISGGFDFIKHQALRYVLEFTGQLPKRLLPFLNYCCELDFLKRVGGGYLFFHRLLLEYFSENAKVEK